MRNLAVFAFLMATTSLASAASNESFIAQVGAHNNAAANQLNGNNRQLTIQAGKHNHATTNQIGPSSGSHTNNSGTVQFGVGNNAMINQIGGNNTQGTFSFGINNTANTNQLTSDSHPGSNNARTGQFGWNNTSNTNEVSTGVADTTTSHPTATHPGGQGGINDSGVLQIGGANTATIAQTSAGSGNGNSARGGVDNNSAAIQVGIGNTA